MIDVTILKQNISPAFYGVHNSIANNEFTHYRLCGGRGSTKSSFISIEIIYGIMKNPDANAVVIRKVGTYLKDSVYAQLEWAIDTLGVGGMWTLKTSPMEMIYAETGQKILFRGADEPKKLKSTKVSKGYVRYIWYEELDEFNGPEEIRTINQSLMRGGEKFDVFYSFNPPRSIQSWVNIEERFISPDTLIHRSTYLDVPKSWIGEQFIAEAEHIKKVQPSVYEHEYLGRVTGTGGEIFTNLHIRPVSDNEINAFDKIRRGVDFGYATDPFVYLEGHFDGHRLFIYREIYKTGLSNSKAIAMIKELGEKRQPIICDSAEPKSINEFREAGLPALGAKKGPDSIEYGIKFLQSLDEIIIDGKRCPNAAREFSHYETDRDKEGNPIARYPDKNNHTIDAARYAMEQDTNFKKGKIIKRSTLWS